MAKELYVGHLSEQTTEEDLRRLFSVMGIVTSVHLIIDPETGEFKRCGYVRMASGVDPAEVAETLDGAYLIDREIHVSIARPQKPGMAGKSTPYKPWLKDRPKPGAGGKPAAKSGKRPAARPATAAEAPAEQRQRPAKGSRPGAKPATRSGTAPAPARGPAGPARPPRSRSPK